MLPLVLMLLAQSAGPSNSRVSRVERVPGGRTPGGRSGGGAAYAFFEAFPASGAGTTGVCSTTAPTGARGETLTFTRASVATCTKTASGGLATTGIADGDVITTAPANAPRVEYDSNGVLGLLVESAGSNICLRSAEICNAAWVDEFAPACSSDQATGPFGTTTMDQFTDDSAIASEGRYQTITSTSLTQYTASCYVKAGTATSATIDIFGTGNSAGACIASVSGLSATTSGIVTCSSTVAFGAGLTAVNVRIVVGASAAVTGTIFVEGCDVKPSAPYLTSYIPTTSAAVTRAAESAAFTLASDRADTTICMAATVTPEWTTPVSFGTVMGYNSPVVSLLSFPSSSPRFFTTAGAVTTSLGGLQRFIGRDDATNVTVAYGANTATAAAGAAGDRWTTALQIGSGAGGDPIDAILTRIQADPIATRCTQ